MMVNVERGAKFSDEIMDNFGCQASYYYHRQKCGENINPWCLTLIWFKVQI